MRKTYYINSKNAVSKTAKSERRFFLNTKSFEEMIYLFSVSRKLIRIEIEKRTSDSFTDIESASFFKQRSPRIIPMIILRIRLDDVYALTNFFKKPNLLSADV